MKRYFPLVVLLMTLAGCGGSSLETIAPPAPLSDFTPDLQVKPLWETRLDKGVGRFFVKLPPLLDAGRVYATDLHGDAESYDARTGKQLWRTNLATPIYAGPGDGGDVVLLGGDEAVFALNKRDGKLAWRVSVGNEVLATPVRAGDTVIARTVDGKVHAIDASTGSIRWHFDQEVPSLSLRGVSAPLIAGDMVICGFANGKVVALSLSDGSERWEAVTAVPRGRNELERMVDVDARLIAHGGHIYAASYQGHVVALDRSSGQMLWSRDISSWSGMAVVDEELYITDAQGDLWALSERNGATLWKQTALHGRRLAPPVVQGEYLVVGDYAGYLHWLARDDGHLAARVRIHQSDYYWPLPSDEPVSDYPEDRGILATPVVAGDSVYVMDKRGVLAVFQVKPNKT